jgi:hypothetical protein
MSAWARPELLRAGLAPFVERELKYAYGDRLTTEVGRLLRIASTEGKPLAQWDAAALLKLMWEPGTRSSEDAGPGRAQPGERTADVRNKWAHQQAFSSDDAYRALDSAGRLLTAVSAPQAHDLEKMKMELLRLRFDEQVRTEKRKARHGHRERGTGGSEALARGGDAAPGRGRAAATSRRSSPPTSGRCMSARARMSTGTRWSSSAAPTSPRA